MFHSIIKGKFVKSKLSTKSNSLKLFIGKTIHVISFSGLPIHGKIINTLPARIVPTNRDMETFYAKDWYVRSCKRDRRAMKYMRALFVNADNGHKMIYPLNTTCKKWEIFGRGK